MIMSSFLFCLLLVASLVVANQAYTADVLPMQHKKQQRQHRQAQTKVSPRSLSATLDESADDSNARTKWPRRVWSKITRKNVRSKNSPVAPLMMMSVDEETETLLESITSYYNNDQQDDFILRNFEEITPSMVLPPSEGEQVQDARIDSSSIDSVWDTTSEMTTRTSKKEKKKKMKKKITIPRFISIGGLIGRLLENILSGIIVRNAAELPEDLKIQAFPKGNLFARLVLRGTICTDARIESAGRLVFPAIRMSNGTLEIKRMKLNIIGFLRNQRMSSSSSRYTQQFDFHADDVTFSRHDLLFSPCVRGGLTTLLVNILKDRGVKSSTIKVSSLDILPNGKISVKGEATTLVNSPLSFEVRTGISTRGHHILTFPGLEVAINRDLGLFVPVVPDLDLDIGHNARLRKVEICGKKKQLRLSASVTITPTSTIRLLDYVQASEAFAARFSCDVGRWLTEVGNFSR